MKRQARLSASDRAQKRKVAEVECFVTPTVQLITRPFDYTRDNEIQFDVFGEQ